MLELSYRESARKKIHANYVKGVKRNHQQYVWKDEEGIWSEKRKRKEGHTSAQNHHTSSNQILNVYAFYLMWIKYQQDMNGGNYG